VLIVLLKSLLYVFDSGIIRRLDKNSDRSLIKWALVFGKLYSSL
jgi:hypothetical protein